MNKCSIMTAKKSSNNAKELILKTALKLFSKNGLEGTSIRMIATEAEISNGLIYNYFPGKDELLQSLFESGFENIRNQIIKKESTSKKTKMDEKLLHLIECLEKNSGFWRLYLVLRHQENVQKLLKDQFSGFRNWLIDHIKAQLKDSGYDGAKSLSLIILSSIEGYMALGLLDKSHISSKNSILLIQKLLA